MSLYGTKIIVRIPAIISNYHFFTTIFPRQFWQINERGEQVKNGPGNNDAVIDVQQKNNNHC